MTETSNERLKGLAADLDAIIERADQYIEKIRGLKGQVPEDVPAEEQDVLSLHSPQPMDRRFNRVEAAALLGVSDAAIIKAEKTGRLPEPDSTSDIAGRDRFAGYTHDQILDMRSALGREKRKPEGAPAMVMGFLNLKGGSQKTSLSLYAGQWFAMQGYRVLLVDTDPQGTLSFMMGHLPDIEVNYEHTVAPFILEDEVGFENLGMDPDAVRSLDYAIRKTHWSNIDLIPSCMENLRIDLELNLKVDRDRRAATRSGLDYDENEVVLKLRNGIQGVAKNYDIVIFDGTPSLNLSTLNVVSACDEIFVPTPSHMVDYSSTIAFAQLLADAARKYAAGDRDVPFPDVSYLITKVTRHSTWMVGLIQKTMGAVDGYLLESIVEISEEIGKQGAHIRTIWELEQKESNNPKALKRARANYDGLYREIHEKHVLPFWGFEQKAAEPGTSKIEEFLTEKGV